MGYAFLCWKPERTLWQTNSLRPKNHYKSTNYPLVICYSSLLKMTQSKLSEFSHENSMVDLCIVFCMFTRPGKWAMVSLLCWCIPQPTHLEVDMLEQRSAEKERALQNEARAATRFAGSSLWWTNSWLVVSNMNFIFHFIYRIVLPIDELIFFKMIKTTNQVCHRKWPCYSWFTY